MRTTEVKSLKQYLLSHWLARSSRLIFLVLWAAVYPTVALAVTAVPAYASLSEDFWVTEIIEGTHYLVTAIACDQTNDATKSCPLV